MSDTRDAHRAVGDQRGLRAARGFADLMVAFRFDARRLTHYDTEFRVVHALFDMLAGLDPGAVRLAQTLLALIPRRRAHPGGSRRAARGTGSAVSPPAGGTPAAAPGWLRRSIR